MMLDVFVIFGIYLPKVVVCGLPGLISTGLKAGIY
ncbi:hypothetical protein LINPERPRIM_LOCUS32384 [Linum perenne]